MARTMAAKDTTVYRAVVRGTFTRGVHTGEPFADVYGPYSTKGAARSVGSAKANQRRSWFGDDTTFYEIEKATFEWEPVK